MKKFEDFKSTITDDDLDSMTNEILDNLNQNPSKDSVEDSFEEIIWFTRSYNLSMTMRLIEKYHNWLHKD